LKPASEVKFDKTMSKLAVDDAVYMKALIKKHGKDFNVS
jgi:hypothetical protein